MIKNKEFDISQRIYNLCISKMNFYSPFTVLPDFTKTTNPPKRAVGETNQLHIQFQDEEYFFLFCKYWFLSLNSNSRGEFFLKKAAKFLGFL